MAHYSRGLSFPTYSGHQSITPVSYTKINIEQDPQKSSGLKIFGNRKPQGVETWGFYTTLHSREEWNKGLLLYPRCLNMAKQTSTNKYKLSQRKPRQTSSSYGERNRRLYVSFFFIYINEAVGSLMTNACNITTLHQKSSPSSYPVID